MLAKMTQQGFLYAWRGDYLHRTSALKVPACAAAMWVMVPGQKQGLI